MEGPTLVDTAAIDRGVIAACSAAALSHVAQDMAAATSALAAYLHQQGPRRGCNQVVCEPPSGRCLCHGPGKGPGHERARRSAGMRRRSARRCTAATSARSSGCAGRSTRRLCSRTTSPRSARAYCCRSCSSSAATWRRRAPAPPQHAHAAAPCSAKGPPLLPAGVCAREHVAYGLLTWQPRARAALSHPGRALTYRALAR